MSALHLVCPSIAASMIKSVLSAHDLPARAEPAIATSEGYARGLERLRTSCWPTVQSQTLRAQLIRKGLL